MKLDVAELYTVSGLTGKFRTLAEAMTAIDKANKVGVFTVSHAMEIVASGAGIAPGQPAVGTAAKPGTAAPK